MGMTLVERILANRAEVESLSAGQIVSLRPDVLLSGEGSFPRAHGSLKRMGGTKVADASRVVMVADRAPLASATAALDEGRAMREFAEENGIASFFNAGRAGASHLLAAESGLVVCGDVVVATDPHATALGALGAFAAGFGALDIGQGWATREVWLRVPESMKISFDGRLQPWVSGRDLALRVLADVGLEGAAYRSIEIGGDAIVKLPVSHRLALCGMLAESGAKCALIPPDETMANWVRGRAARPVRLYKADIDAAYTDSRTYDLTALGPLVAPPPHPSTARPVEEFGNVRVDLVYIGGCTAGTLDDLRVAAAMLSGAGKVNRALRMLVQPGTQGAYLEAVREGAIEALLAAGAVLLPPGCGPCPTAQLPLLGAGENAVSTTHDCSPGALGGAGEIYLASVAVAVASAMTGVITDPRQVRK